MYRKCSESLNKQSLKASFITQELRRVTICKATISPARIRKVGEIKAELKIMFQPRFCGRYSGTADTSSSIWREVKRLAQLALKGFTRGFNLEHWSEVRLRSRFTQKQDMLRHSAKTRRPISFVNASRTAGSDQLLNASFTQEVYFYCPAT